MNDPMIVLLKKEKHVRKGVLGRSDRLQPCSFSYHVLDRRQQTRGNECRISLIIRSSCVETTTITKLQNNVNLTFPFGNFICSHNIGMILCEKQNVRHLRCYDSAPTFLSSCHVPNSKTFSKGIRRTKVLKMSISFFNSFKNKSETRST